MQFQAFNKILIEDQNILPYKAGDVTVGYEFRIRYPSYRGTYLSCIEKLEISVDGRKIDPENLIFVLNGIEYTISQIKDQYKTYWFVLDFATIRVMEDTLAEGMHEITVDMYHRIPYAGYEGSYLGLPSCVTKKLTYCA
ncbi:MAG: hypothetical protein J6P87_03535 [Lachnospiraceae bacterium]|nr:hypothetical protein [Lachnospiraceae bacterium]